MPLIPTTAAAAAGLLSRITNPPRPQKLHSAAAPINRAPDDSSSVRSVSDPPSPSPPVELELLPLRPKHTSPPAPSRPKSMSSDSTVSTTPSTDNQASHQQRRKLSNQIWRAYW
ncbi:hypothetical protein F66182_6143 [Fusarium sp. NRRL 66182]|nr:hypothetical protein F66182_6143 [Fusarium sp. NRRL 66182]